MPVVKWQFGKKNESGQPASAGQSSQSDKPSIIKKILSLFGK